jgi:hypothetical protein
MCAFLGHDAAHGGNFIPTFRDTLCAPSSKRPIGCFETSVTNYRYRLRDIPSGRRTHLLRTEAWNHATTFCARNFSSREWKRNRAKVAEESCLVTTLMVAQSCCCPTRFQSVGTLYLNLCSLRTRVHIQVAILRVLDCIVTILFGVYLVLWLF